MDVLLCGNDQSIEATGLQDADSEEYLNEAAVTATLKNQNGTEVSGESWPITLEYVDGSDGDYRGVFEDGIALVAGHSYIVEISADAGDDLVAFWRFTRRAIYRTP